MQQLFLLSLSLFCEKRGWGKKMPREGAQLRAHGSQEKLVHCKELQGKKRFDADKFNKLVKGGLHFSLPKKALTDIPETECYVRRRGGSTGLPINHPPHLSVPASRTS